MTRTRAARDGYQHAALLQVDENPENWSDDDAVYALSLLGADVPCDLILGDAAYRLWLESVRVPTAAVTDPDLATRYAALADAALKQDAADSSAGGEFPKFTALRQVGGAATDAVAHVIVKFSGSDHSPGARRWADLLVCEHLASRILPSHLQISAAKSVIHRAGGRTFLEVTRFDRHGRHGRSGMLSLTVIKAALLGASAGPWPVTAAKLGPLGLLDESSLETIARLWHFGRLIGNTDMHEGHLSFMPPWRERVNCA